MKIPEILLIESAHKPGSLGKILTVIGEAGIVVEHLNAVRREQDQTIWEITLEMDPETDGGVIDQINALPNAKIIGRSDRIMDRHRDGKIRMVSRVPIGSIQQLRDIYTPGVARVSLAIQADPALQWEYTALKHTVAIVTNGTAVLGLGDVGVAAALPVMEGKSALFAQLAKISGIPILIDEKDPERLIDTICAIAPSFGAIQLEDIAAPLCFEVEEGLKARLDRPVMHDDQHGTAVVTLAALINATARVDVDLRDSVVGQIGLGAAGIGIARLLRSYGVKRVLGADIHPHAIERLERFGGEGRSLDALMAEADIVIATTGVPGLIKPEKVRPGQIILALSNPEPEIAPRRALQQGAIFAADGGSVNNALGFPGLFRGALEARATQFTDEMLFAAANALAELTPTDALVPYVLDLEVHAKVAEAVKEAALGLGARGTLRLSI
jgi:malate dehydrogenase (oxaloacetate-decarboxylating)